jgi:hypothetical protein
MFEKLGTSQWIIRASHTGDLQTPPELSGDLKRGALYVVRSFRHDDTDLQLDGICYGGALIT